MHIKDKAMATLKQLDMRGKLTGLPVLPKASVLIPLFVRGGELHALFTLRTGAGEVCFPGGKRDPSDRDDVDTALREAQEEIALPPDEVQVVCVLFPVVTKEGVLVTPVIGFIDEAFSPRPNPAEVSAVFSVPLDFFTREDYHSSKTIPGFAGILHSFQFLDPESGREYSIWGLTSFLGLLVAAMVTKKKPQFDLGFDPENPLPYLRLSVCEMMSRL